MALGREFPHSFDEALKMAKKILSGRQELVRRNTLDAESELLVLAAYRETQGRALSRHELFSRLGDRYPETAGAKLITLASLRAEGRILQHLTGFQHFLDHEYQVSPAVLVPRPETEVLVVTAVKELKASRPVLGFEVGTGSGAISIELLCQLPGLKMISSELTDAALAVATHNAERILGVPPGPGALSRLEFVKVRSPLEVLEPFRGQADFLISNPPYLTGREEVDEEVFLHEPHTALFAPSGDPLYFYRRIAEGAARILGAAGRVFLEMPHERAAEISKLFQAHGWLCKIENDLSGRERVLVARRAEQGKN